MFNGVKLNLLLAYSLDHVLDNLHIFTLVCCQGCSLCQIDGQYSTNLASCSITMWVHYSLFTYCTVWFGYTWQSWLCNWSTGHNGTINGKGQTWWNKYRKKLLNHTRGPLVQIMWSSNIHISDITLRDSPFWTLHPYDCKNVTIRNVTILAPLFKAPNTDGIDPGKLALLLEFMWWASLLFINRKICLYG